MRIHRKVATLRYLQLQQREARPAPLIYAFLIGLVAALILLFFARLGLAAGLLLQLGGGW